MSLNGKRVSLAILLLLAPYTSYAAPQATITLESLLADGYKIIDIKQAIGGPSFTLEKNGSRYVCYTADKPMPPGRSPKICERPR